MLSKKHFPFSAEGEGGSLSTRHLLKPEAHRADGQSVHIAKIIQRDREETSKDKRLHVGVEDSAAATLTGDTVLGVAWETGRA